MSHCADCGVYVRFLVLSEVEGRRVWSPPLTPVDSQVKVLHKSKPAFEQAYRLTETYEVHQCEQSKEREARERQNYAIAKDRRRQAQEAWTEALKGACPKCHVERRVKCVNLSDVRHGKVPREISWPHRERLPDNWLEENSNGQA